MKSIITSFLGALTLMAAIFSSAYATTPDPLTEPLLHSSNLQYEGSFQVPGGGTNQTSFAYGGRGITYDPVNNGLIMTGHPWYQYTAEISIPTPIKSTSISGLPTATFIQNFTDALDGKLNSINPTGPNPNVIGGYLVYNGNLIISAYSTYDAGDSQIASHFSRNLTLSSTNPVIGPERVGTLYPGFVSGYMSLIPPEWQNLFGGPALTGNCCLSIASLQSNGPAASVFDPSQLSAAQSIPATPVLGYPYPHTLGPGDTSQSTQFNLSTNIRGLVFPNGTRSVLFIGTQGIGPYCYGPGTSDTTLAGTPANSADDWCYDPTNASKGPHAYPYVYQVWAYDANTLLSVENGAIPQYSPTPYAIWTLKLPYTTDTSPISIGGAAYDPSTGTLYISQGCVASACTPIIDVFKITLTSEPTPNPPSAATVH